MHQMLFWQLGKMQLPLACCGCYIWRQCCPSAPEWHMQVRKRSNDCTTTCCLANALCFDLWNVRYAGSRAIYGAACCTGHITLLMQVVNWPISCTTASLHTLSCLLAMLMQRKAHKCVSFLSLAKWSLHLLQALPLLGFSSVLLLSLAAVMQFLLWA